MWRKRYFTTNELVPTTSNGTLISFQQQENVKSLIKTIYKTGCDKLITPSILLQFSTINDETRIYTHRVTSLLDDLIRLNVHFYVGYVPVSKCVFCHSDKLSVARTSRLGKIQICCHDCESRSNFAIPPVVVSTWTKLLKNASRDE